MEVGPEAQGPGEVKAKVKRKRAVCSSLRADVRTYDVLPISVHRTAKRRVARPQNKNVIRTNKVKRRLTSQHRRPYASHYDYTSADQGGASLTLASRHRGTNNKESNTPVCMT